MRINTSLQGLTFEITDFDLYKKSKNFHFDEFYKFYKEFIIQLEYYALNLGFIQIIVNINSYLDKNLNMLLEPIKVNGKDLNLLITNDEYSDRENELIKISIIKQLGYADYNYSQSKKTDNLK